MTVLLAGATGTLGSALLAQPAASAYRIRAAARRVPSTGRGDVEWQRIDIATGEGVEAAVAGVDVVIHAASAPRGDTARTDVGGTGRLLAAAARAGVRHLLYISIVGVDRIPHAYYRHKVAAEKVVQGGAVPWTILRGTQFHDLMDSWFHGLARFPLAVAPRGWLVQPIHVADFAGEVWRSVAEGPTGRVPDAAGPEVLTWQAMLEAWWRARGRPRRVFPLPVPGRLSSALRAGAATAPRDAVGTLTWAQWLESKYGASATPSPRDS